MELASKGQLRASYLRWAVVTVPLVLLLGFLSARLFPTGSDNCWYALLVKPAATPPDWLFPVAWTTLYILLGLALAMVVNARGSRSRGSAIALFAAQLAANLIWSPVFFGAHQVLAALVVIAAMWVLAVATTIVFGRVRSVAAWLMVPYLVWITVAGILTWQVHALNPDAASLVCGSARTQMAL